MQLNLRTLLLLTMFLLLTTATSEAAQSVRGAWVTAWTAGLRTRQEIDATLAAAQRARLNTLFWQVRKTADAYYASAIEPSGDGVPAGFDPLAYSIQEAHERKIKIHAWVNAYRIWKPDKQPPTPDHLVLRKPEWLNRNYAGETSSADGYFLDPGIPEVRAYMVKLIADIDKRYAVDGIHLDFIRYPGTDWGYSDLALKHYYKDTGETAKPKPTDAKWSEWRRERVTLLVRDIKKQVHKPLSVTTVCWGRCTPEFCDTAAHSRAFQDWPEWCAKGYVDAVTPMCYFKESKQEHAAWYREWVREFKRLAAGRPVYVGVGAYLNTPKETRTQLGIVSSNKHDGFVLFSFNQSPARDALVAELSR